MVDISYSTEIRAVFLLFIAISANFLGNTLNCNLQKTLIESSILRHFFLFLIIFFTIDFASKSELEPLEIFKKSLLIYIFYILLTKQNFQFLSVIIVLLILIYLTNIKINVKKNKLEDTTDMEKTMKYLCYITGLVSIVGFALYLKKQYKDHYKTFDILKFIFGTNKCQSL
jgi:hypothetical protein